MSTLNKAMELRLGANSKYMLDGGLCLDQESNIALSQSPNLLNLTLDDGGLLTSRLGQANVFTTSLGTGKVNAVYPDYKGKTLFQYGAKLYTQEDNEQPIEIFSGLANNKACFFVYNSLLYLKTIGRLLSYDGVTVKDVEPYAPILSINRKPDGSQSTVNESWNLIGRAFREQFNPDGTTKVFKLSFTNLDADTVICNQGGTEGSGFTVNRTTGEVTFTTAPVAGTNTLELKAFKTFAGNADQIMNCTRAYEGYGRIFMYGNSNMKNSYWVMGISDSNDCSYFPTKYRYNLTKTNKELTSFINHFGLLIGLTEDLTFKIEEGNFDNLASFPVKYINTSLGCDIPESVQLINNNPVWANTYAGVCMLTSSLIPGEKNIAVLSQNINGDFERPGLLSEPNLKDAVSVDYDGKYILNVGSYAYVWDYLKGFKASEPVSCKWFKWDNIKASCFFIKDNTLMYGHKERGQLCKFISALNDFGSPINKVFRTKLLDFGYPDYQKTVLDLWLTTRANSNSLLTIKYYDDNGDISEPIDIPQSTTNSFNWANFSWSSFTYKVQRFAPTIRKKPRLKKIRYFQLELSNNQFNQNLSIISLVLNYSLTRKVR
jgi:hypothetical protein